MTLHQSRVQNLEETGPEETSHFEPHLQQIHQLNLGEKLEGIFKEKQYTPQWKQNYVFFSMYLAKLNWVLFYDGQKSPKICLCKL